MINSSARGGSIAKRPKDPKIIVKKHFISAAITVDSSYDGIQNERFVKADGFCKFIICKPLC